MFIINRFIVINILLNARIYKEKPDITPIKIYNLSSPLLNLNIQNSNNNPDKSQNIKSWIYVTISEVLKALRSILNISNNIPIKKPDKINTKKTYNWFSKLSPAYLNIFPSNEEPFLSLVFSK